MFEYIQKLEAELFQEVESIDKDGRQTEGKLKYQMAIYNSTSKDEERKLISYVRFLESALEDKEKQLKALSAELTILKTRRKELAEEHDRYSRPG